MPEPALVEFCVDLYRLCVAANLSDRDWNPVVLTRQ